MTNTGVKLTSTMQLATDVSRTAQWLASMSAQNRSPVPTMPSMSTAGRGVASAAEEVSRRSRRRPTGNSKRASATPMRRNSVDVASTSLTRTRIGAAATPHALIRRSP